MGAPPPISLSVSYKKDAMGKWRPTAKDSRGSCNRRFALDRRRDIALRNINIFSAIFTPEMPLGKARSPDEFGTPARGTTNAGKDRPTSFGAKVFRTCHIPTIRNDHLTALDKRDSGVFTGITIDAHGNLLGIIIPPTNSGEDPLKNEQRRLSFHKRSSPHTKEQYQTADSYFIEV